MVTPLSAAGAPVNRLVHPLSDAFGDTLAGGGGTRAAAAPKHGDI